MQLHPAAPFVRLIDDECSFSHSAILVARDGHCERQPNFMGQLLTELAGEDRAPGVRTLAGLHFKNLLDAKVLLLSTSARISGKTNRNLPLRTTG